MNPSEAIARVLHPSAPRDALCLHFGHDPNGENVCRDCGVTVKPGDPVCASEPRGGWGPIG